MGITDNQNFKNLLKSNKEKLGVLRKILEVSLRIKDEADSGGEDAPDNIAAHADAREELIEKMKNIDLAVKHYGSELSGFNIAGLPPESELSKVLAEIKTVLDAIKSADEINRERLSFLMQGIKQKIKAVKENRTLMDKFMGDGEMSSAGTLLSEKK